MYISANISKILTPETKRVMAEKNNLDNAP